MTSLCLSLGADGHDSAPSLWVGGLEGPRTVCVELACRIVEPRVRNRPECFASSICAARDVDTMLKEFNIAERGAGPYWLLAILRWVMVLIFVSFGIQKFTPQSAQGIAVYISNSPFVSWLSIFGING
jgi:Protein of unknown function, DUF417